MAHCWILKTFIWAPNGTVSLSLSFTPFPSVSFISPSLFPFLSLLLSLSLFHSLSLPPSLSLPLSHRVMDEMGAPVRVRPRSGRHAPTDMSVINLSLSEPALPIRRTPGLMALACPRDLQPTGPEWHGVPLCWGRRAHFPHSSRHTALTALHPSCPRLARAFLAYLFMFIFVSSSS